MPAEILKPLSDDERRARAVSIREYGGADPVGTLSPLPARGKPTMLEMEQLRRLTIHAANGDPGALKGLKRLHTRVESRG